jgi:hypothetical protein
MKITFLYLFSLIGLFFIASKIAKSNSAYVETEGKDSEDVVAIVKLNQLVEGNFLNRDYYEVEAGSHWVANYNKKHQALLLSGSPMSGWSYFFYATPNDLKRISQKEIPAKDLYHFLKPFPPEQLSECPTRSRDTFSFF